jgi:hypothetical protein
MISTTKAVLSPPAELRLGLFGSRGTSEWRAHALAT